MKRRLAPAVAMSAAAVTALSTVGLMTLPAHASAPSSQAIAGVVPNWATPSAARGALPGSTMIKAARIFLASRDAAGLAHYAVAVATPGSTVYHKYLTPAQSYARFGSLPEAPAKVAAWAKSAGLTVVRSNRHYVQFNGTVDQISRAFGARFERFAVGGKIVHSVVGQVTVPSAIRSYVMTITGLSSQLVPNRPMTASNGTAVKKPAAKAFPCSAYEGQKMAKKYPKAYGETQPFAVCGYGPQQLNGAYGPKKDGYTGKGYTVAVIDAYALPTMAKDLNKWDKNRGWQKIKKGQYKESVPSGTGYNDGWAGEEALDVEAIHSMAPDAGIYYVAAQTPSDNSFFDAFGRINDKKLADAVNNSWEGGTDAQTGSSTITAFENYFQTGATEGIGYYFSSGDGGGGGTLYPSVDPYVTAVGGTAIGIGKKNNYLWETDWETDYTQLSGSGKKWDPKPPGTFSSGTGGGTSAVFSQPKWQKGVVPGKFSAGGTKEASPDISAEADPTTGFLFGYSSQSGSKWVYGEGRIGGTSLSSPLIVGMQADAEQAAGASIGFANPVIYKMYGTKSYHDVVQWALGKGKMIAHVRTADFGAGTVVALGTAGQAADGQLACVKGYDTTTGVGTPTANYFKAYAK